MVDTIEMDSILKLIEDNGIHFLTNGRLGGNVKTRDNGFQIADVDTTLSGTQARVTLRGGSKSKRFIMTIHVFLVRAFLSTASTPPRFGVSAILSTRPIAKSLKKPLSLGRQMRLIGERCASCLSPHRYLRPFFTTWFCPMRERYAFYGGASPLLGITQEASGQRARAVCTIA